MDTELLKTFLEVRTTRHFGRAAENLFITQAAVSARIKLLEESLGVTLFIRKRNNLQLSGEGERLVPHAETVLRALARARQEVASLDGDYSKVHIGVRTGIWGDALQLKLHELQQEMPDLHVQIRSFEPDLLIQMLMEKTLDLAVLYEAPGLPELQCSPVGQVNLKLYSTREMETLEGALGNNYVYLEWGGAFARFHERRFGDQCRPVLHTNMSHLATDYLLSKGGSCYLPDTVGRHYAHAGLRPVAEAPEFPRRLNMAYRTSSNKVALLEGVVNCFSGVEV